MSKFGRSWQLLPLYGLIALTHLPALAGERKDARVLKKPHKQQATPATKDEDRQNYRAVRLTTEVQATLNKKSKDERMKESALSNTSSQKDVPPPPTAEPADKAPAGSTTERRRFGSDTEKE